MKQLLIALAVMTTLAACKSDDKSSGTGGTGVVAGTGVAGTAAAGTGAAGTAAAAGTGAMCPADPNIHQCGGVACPMISTALSALCVQGCCTTDGKCGSVMAASAGAACTVLETTPASTCPNETVSGFAATGCCVMNTNDCGLTLVGAGNTCVARMSLPIGGPLPPLHCDGTPVEGGAGTGAAGTTAGTGAAGTAAGTGAAGTAAGTGAAGTAAGSGI